MKPRLVVGIGASAGGIEALEQLVRHLDPELDVTYVVVQHLPSDHKTMMPSIIARWTSLPVSMAEAGRELETRTIIVLPPGAPMRLEDGVLHDVERDEAAPINQINTLFASMAEECGDEAVGIILSGTGSDGADGALQIMRKGGLVMAQDRSARFEDMPLAAISNGSAAVVAAPSRLASFLSRHYEEPGVFRASVRSSDDETETLSDEENEIIDALRGRYHFDFSAYREGMISRRIHRQAGLVSNDDLAAYAKTVRTDGQALEALYRDLLIGVTSFFRDAHAYRAIEEQVVPAIVSRARNRDQIIRVWCAGCATGEEAYSIAMLLDEALARLKIAASLKLFATDVHPGSLEFAANRTYDLERLEHVSPLRRERYFEIDGDSARVVDHIRSKVSFVHHDILNDVPFANMDLLVCRNMLIYLKRAAQVEALRRLHFSARLDGFLFLGRSESIGELKDAFVAVDPANRIYRKIRSGPLPSVRGSFTTDSSRIPMARPNRFEVAGRRITEIYDEVLGTVFDRAVLVTHTRDVIYTFGDAADLLGVPAGRVSGDVLQLIRSDDVRLAVATAIHRAQHEHRTASVGSARFVRADGGEDAVQVTVKPVAPDDPRTNFLIVFGRVALPPPVAELDEVAETTGQRPINRDAVRSDRIASLEDELREARENLQSTLEEMEASNEELVVANEELHTLNEELQASNEELETVNTEYQRRLSELEEAAVTLRSVHGRPGPTLGAAFGSIMDALTAASWIKDRAGRYLHVNRTWLELSGVTNVSAAIGRTDTEIFGAEVALRLQREDEAVFAVGHPVSRIGDVLSRATSGQRWLVTRFLFQTSSGDGVGGIAVPLPDGPSIEVRDLLSGDASGRGERGTAAGDVPGDGPGASAAPGTGG